MLIIAIISICYVSGFGLTGHTLTGMIASELLSQKGSEFVDKLLPEYRDNKLGQAAPWADSIKSNHQYDWAKPLHYINPVGDNPPTHCQFANVPEDCPGNQCILPAIYNYTQQLVESEKWKTNGNEALKFLIHFIGDIHQPLHTSNFLLIKASRQKGGNNALVRWNGRIGSLHSVWDSKMIEKRISDDFGNNKQKYVQFIVKEIGVRWRGEISEWLQCDNPDTPSPLTLIREKEMGFKNRRYKNQCDYEAKCSVSSKEPKLLLTEIVCPEKWVKRSSEINCESVWPEYKRKYELNGNYYEKNIKVQEKLLAQAAVRIATIINVIANPN